MHARECRPAGRELPVLFWANDPMCALCQPCMRYAACILYSCQSQENEREAEGETEGEGGGKCACMHVRAHSPLTTPPSTSAAASPPPPHTIVGIDACRTQCGGCAVCWEECFAESGGERSDRRQ